MSANPWRSSWRSSAAAAEDALDAIALDIEPLPAVVDGAAAARGDVLLVEAAGSNVAFTITGVRGDADAAFEWAPYTRCERFKRATPRRGADGAARTAGGMGSCAGQDHGATARPRSPSSTGGYWRSNWDCRKAPSRMVENDVGGGFGARGEFYPEDFLIPFAARRIGRPVKWIEDRREHSSPPTMRATPNASWRSPATATAPFSACAAAP